MGDEVEWHEGEGAFRDYVMAKIEGRDVLICVLGLMRRVPCDGYYLSLARAGRLIRVEAPGIDMRTAKRLAEVIARTLTESGCGP